MQDQKMKAITMKNYGGPEVLELKSVNIPQVEDDQVLVEVVASSATTADSQMRSGQPYFARFFTGFPRPKHEVPGTGFAGIVVKKGSAVQKFDIGNRVFGETTLGFSTNAEFVAVPESGIILPLPEEIDFSEASTYGDGPITSYNFLNEIAQVKKGQKVLINGASGSLGTAAVQIAKYLGAEVTGVSSTRNQKLLQSLGADHVIDYSKSDFTQGTERYDVIFDSIGKSSFAKSKKVLTEKGTYLSPVLSGKLLLNMLLTSLRDKKALFAATGLRKDHELRGFMKELIQIRLDGHLRTIIDRQFPLEKTKEAHTYVATGRKRGNVIISVKQ